MALVTIISMATAKLCGVNIGASLLGAFSGGRQRAVGSGRCSLRRAAGLDESLDLGPARHGAGPDLRATKCGAGVGEYADLLVAPALQQGVGEPAHERVPGAGGVHDVCAKRR